MQLATTDWFLDNFTYLLIQLLLENVLGKSLVLSENTPEKLFKTEICTGGPPVLCGKPWVRHSFNRNEQSYTDFEISQEYYDDFLVKGMWPSASQCKTIFI